ncbi:hypothetical protein N7467_000751 [Penicillium canescens]|nr:hypothetical protein N7467_000751 [Penicillium canescens]
MSATTTSTLTTTTLVGTMKGVAVSEKQCPMCWGEGLHDSGAQDRIQELEGQLHMLTARASATATKLTEYEDEIRRLRSQSQTQNYSTPRSSASLPPSTSTSTSNSTPQDPPRPTTSPTTATYHSRLATLTSLLPYRRSSATPTSTTSVPAAPPTTSTVPPPATPTLPNPPNHNHPAQASPASSDNTSELQDALEREQGLRKAAESQLSQASTELEELTVQLFSQANEMVAQEREGAREA